MVDVHCHILPETDDGPSSWATAVEMCRMAANDGITHIVCSPHCNEVYAYDRPRHVATLLRLQEKIAGTPALSLGCDFHFSAENLKRLLAKPSQFTIGNTGYLLVELSDFSIPPNLAEKLQQLMSMGIKPIITHPERNLLLQRRREVVLEWAQIGAAIQVTANSLTGSWGPVAKQAALWLLQRKAVHVVASDAHDTRHRPPLLSPVRELLTAIAGAEIAEALLCANPQAIVSGAELPYFPAIVARSAHKS